MWTTTSNPSKSDWYICVVLDTNARLPLRYNQPNNFWCGMDGKTYQPNQIKWLNDDYK